MYVFVFFRLVDTKQTGLIWLAFAGAFIGLLVMYAPVAAFLAEQFKTRVRYSGVSLASQLGAVLGGGFAPLIATALLAWGGGASWVVAAYVCVALLISFVSALLLKETYQADLAEEAPELGTLKHKKRPSPMNRTPATNGLSEQPLTNVIGRHMTFVRVKDITSDYYPWRRSRVLLPVPPINPARQG